MTNPKTVRCVLRHCDDSGLHFDLVFDDNCIKTVKLDAYQVRGYRGAGIRAIIEDVALQYYEQLGEPQQEIALIFI